MDPTVHVVLAWIYKFGLVCLPHSYNTIYIQFIIFEIKAILFYVFLESGCPFRIRHLDDVIESDTTGLHRKEKEKALRYEHLNAEQFDVVDKLMRGGIRQESLPCQKPKVVRMFVCSSGPGKSK